LVTKTDKTNPHPLTDNPGSAPAWHPRMGRCAGLQWERREDPCGKRANSEGLRSLFPSPVTSTYRDQKKQKKEKPSLVTNYEEPLLAASSIAKAKY
jgi:hypothetical protein